MTTVSTYDQHVRRQTVSLFYLLFCSGKCKSTVRGQWKRGVQSKKVGDSKRHDPPALRRTGPKEIDSSLGACDTAAAALQRLACRREPKNPTSRASVQPSCAFVRSTKLAKSRPSDGSLPRSRQRRWNSEVHSNSSPLKPVNSAKGRKEAELRKLPCAAKRENTASTNLDRSPVSRSATTGSPTVAFAM